MSKTLTSIIEFLIQSGILYAVGIVAIRFLSAHTKSKRLALAEAWAQQALASALESSPEDSRQQAIQNLITILGKNKYGKLFDDDRVAELIDHAIASVGKSGVIVSEATPVDVVTTTVVPVAEEVK